jgi:hypothetical protein
MNPSLYHKFLDISIIPDGLNPIEANNPLGLVRFHGIQSDRNNRCVKKIMIETRIYSGSRINLGLVRFYGIQSGRNNRYIKKFVIKTRIHSGLRFNLLIMIGRTRDRRAALISHLLTSGLIPSLMVCLS